MKKILLMLLLSALLLSGCGAKDSGNSMPVETNQPSENMSNSEQTEEPKQAEDMKQTEEPEQTENMKQTEVTKQAEEDSSQQSLSERIAMEISAAEEQEAEVDKKIEQMQEEAVTQSEMNETAEETYKLWNDTLNVVWGLLEANLNEADMEVLRKEEREWIAFKDAEVQAAGEENGGGSLQPLLEAMKAAELTKARVYELAEYAEGK